jgi:putative DNA primase/helicase
MQEPKALCTELCGHGIDPGRHRAIDGGFERKRADRLFEHLERDVGLSLFLTALARRSFDLAPVHAIMAPTSGTGKSLLVSLASILVCGQTAPVIAMGGDKNEFRKLFASQLLSGTPIIAIDNCEQPLTGDLLCQAVSEEQKEIRLFGHLQTAVVRAGSLITATGNSLTIGSDMSRRVLMSMLDAGMERPEKRVFKGSIKTQFRQRRGELVGALLTVLRAARLAHAEIAQMGLALLGGFEGWCAWVRDPLVWLDRADPVTSVEASYENNVDREVRQTVLLAWRDSIGVGAVSSPQEVIDQAGQLWNLGGHCHPALREALLLVAEDRHSPGNLSAKRLGWWLRKVNGQPIGNLRLVKVKSSPHGDPRWTLETI